MAEDGSGGLSAKHRPQSPWEVSEALRAGRERLVLPPITTHAFRHLHASLLLGAGLSIRVVSRHLGLANPAVAMTVYAHALAPDPIAAVQAVEWVLGVWEETLLVHQPAHLRAALEMPSQLPLEGYAPLLRLRRLRIGAKHHAPSADGCQARCQCLRSSRSGSRSARR